MKKRSKLALGLVTLVSAITLASCSSTSKDTKLVTMKGDTITVSDFYKEIKSTTSAQQSMLTLVLTKVFEEQYGKKVADSDVEAAYKKTAESYGSAFSSALAAQGMTAETYKQQIRTTMLVEYAVKQAAEKELTEANYKSAYDSYTPEVTTQVIKLDSEDTAKSVLEQVKAEGADFSSIAKDKTTQSDKKIEYKFDSAGTSLPTDVMSAAFKLDKDGISDVISVLDSSTYTTSYYIVKVTNKTEKNADWKTYKSSLKKIIINQKTKDTNFQNQVISKALSKANVKIKDSAFAGILSQYASTNSSSSTSSSSSEASSESSSSSEAASDTSNSSEAANTDASSTEEASN